MQVLRGPEENNMRKATFPDKMKTVIGGQRGPEGVRGGHRGSQGVTRGQRVSECSWGVRRLYIKSLAHNTKNVEYVETETDRDSSKHVETKTIFRLLE